MNRILIIDDEASICSSLHFALEDEYEVHSTTDPFEGLEWSQEQSFDLCLLDLKIGAVDGIEVLQELKKHQPELIIVMMTAFGSISTSVEAMKKGAYSYLTKPLHMDELFSLIKQALNFKRLNQQVEYLSKELERKYGYEGMIGHSPAIRKAFRMIERVKDIDTNICITGESGTGKELVARAIHFSGKRKQGHFEVVNCAAIPENLLESELFGHEKGAFTGAASRREGKFQLANHGTIFLDEIGDMPYSLQAKLLRVIQEREITPLGSDQRVQLDVRIIAATNQDLKQAVKSGTFREDLYFRLNVIELELPPLRDRKQDLPLLFHHFIQKFNVELNKKIKGLTPEAMECLQNYHFPGNVRELMNIIEAAMVIADGNYIQLEDLSKEVRAKGASLRREQDVEYSIKQLVGYSMKEVEKLMILATLEECEGHRKKTAEVLGISERGLRDKLKSYNVEN